MVPSISNKGYPNFNLYKYNVSLTNPIIIFQLEECHYFTKYSTMILIVSHMSMILLWGKTSTLPGAPLVAGVHQRPTFLDLLLKADVIAMFV